MWQQILSVLVSSTAGAAAVVMNRWLEISLEQRRSRSLLRSHGRHITPDGPVHVIQVGRESLLLERR